MNPTSTASVRDNATVPVSNPAPGFSAQTPETGGFVGFADSPVDLGEVPWATNEPVFLSFINQSDEPVTIDSVQSSCNCALAHDALDYTGKTLLPGEQLLIELAMDTGTKPGSKDALIQLTTSDGRLFTALIHARVVGTWTISPHTVSFGEVFLDDAADRVETVTFLSDTDQLAGTPQANVPWLTCSVQPAAPGKPAEEVQLRILKDKLLPGVNLAHVTVTTTSRSVPSAQILVSARGTTALLPYPSHLVLSPGGEGSIRFVDQAGHRIHLTSYELPTPALTGALLEDGLLVLRALPSPSTPLKNPITVVVHDRFGQRGRALVSILDTLD